MSKKKEAMPHKHKTFLVPVFCLLSCVTGMAIAHLIWYLAIFGLVESDVNAALLAGNDITGIFEYAERYEDSYLAHVTTDTFGEVTIKIPVEVAQSLEKGASVQIQDTLTLVEIKEVSDEDA